MPFKQIKSDTLNLRVSPAFKEALKSVAARENRSMVNALEWLILDYFKRNKLGLPEQQRGRTTRKSADRKRA